MTTKQIVIAQKLEKLEQCGLALFGNTWKKSLADALEIKPANLTAYYLGTRPMPTKYWEKIKNLHYVRLAELNENLEKL